MAYRPDYAIMTNIDFHPEYYTLSMMYKVPLKPLQTSGKRIIACGDD